MRKMLSLRKMPPSRKTLPLWKTTPLFRKTSPSQKRRCRRSCIWCVAKSPEEEAAMAVVLGKQSALRVWDSVVAGRDFGARVNQSTPCGRTAISGQSVPVGQRISLDQIDSTGRNAPLGQSNSACQSVPVGRSMPIDHSMPTGRNVFFEPSGSTGRNALTGRNVLIDQGGPASRSGSFNRNGSGSHGSSSDPYANGALSAPGSCGASSDCRARVALGVPAASCGIPAASRDIPIASQGVPAANQSVSFAFQDARDYRRTLERDTKAAVKFFESAVTPELTPAVRDRFFSDGSLIHATVAHARLRRAGGGIETSVRKGPFHPRSFMRIEDGLYVSTPEMAFCEMASVLSLERLIALGFELCGTYRRASTFGLAQYDATPLTSPGALASFIEKSPQFKGVKKARRALPCILAGSASPRESELAMLLCLPYSLGGYGLPHPTMNAEMPLPKNVAATGRSSLRCDLYWSAARLDVEYDGAEFHSAERLLANDSMRRIALESMDVTSVNLTAEHLRRASLFDEAAQGIARILGKRVRLPGDFRLKQEGLWRELGIVSSDMGLLPTMGASDSSELNERVSPVLG